MLQGPFDRRSLFASIGAVCCISAVLLAPLAASPDSSTRNADRTLADIQGLPTLPLTTRRSEHLSVARDPFVEPPEIAARTQRLRASQEAGSAIQVEGIINGDRPRALMRIGNAERIVAIGDSIEGVKIIDIDDAGVRLTSGLRLRPITGNLR